VRRINLDQIQEGTMLAKTIMTLEGKILLSSGVTLNAEHIKRLQTNGITEIYIEDEISKDIHVPDFIRDEITTEAKLLVKK
jgi:hypothetical protein